MLGNLRKTVTNSASLYTKIHSSPLWDTWESSPAASKFIRKIYMWRQPSRVMNLQGKSQVGTTQFAVSQPFHSRGFWKWNSLRPQQQAVREMAPSTTAVLLWKAISLHSLLYSNCNWVGGGEGVCSIGEAVYQERTVVRSWNFAWK